MRHAVDVILRVPVGAISRIDGWLRSQPAVSNSNLTNKEETVICFGKGEGRWCETITANPPEAELAWSAYCGRAEAKVLQLQYVGSVVWLYRIS